MKISRGNVILQIGKKTFWRYIFCILLYYITFCTTLYFTTYKGHHLSKHYPALFIIFGSMDFFFLFSNNACLEFLLGSSQSGRSHAVPIQYLG